jgi:hypothetical protein
MAAQHALMWVSPLHPQTAGGNGVHKSGIEVQLPLSAAQLSRMQYSPSLQSGFC